MVVQRSPLHSSSQSLPPDRGYHPPVVAMASHFWCPRSSVSAGHHAERGGGEKGREGGEGGKKIKPLRCALKVLQILHKYMYICEPPHQSSMYLGKSDSSNPRHQILFVGNTQMDNLLLVLCQRSSRLKKARKKDINIWYTCSFIVHVCVCESLVLIRSLES